MNSDEQMRFVQALRDARDKTGTAAIGRLLATGETLGEGTDEFEPADVAANLALILREVEPLVEALCLDDVERSEEGWRSYTSLRNYVESDHHRNE